MRSRQARAGRGKGARRRGVSGEPGGEGLGTLGLSENKAREMTEAAGFTRFRKLDIEHSVNAFYEVRP